MPTSFANDIAPMFLPAQVMCMKNKGVGLLDFQYMSDASGDDTYADHANARHVYGRLSGNEGNRMPPGGPYWSQKMLSKFADWMTGGFLA